MLRLRRSKSCLGATGTAVPADGARRMLSFAEHALGARPDFATLARAQPKAEHEHVASCSALLGNSTAPLTKATLLFRPSAALALALAGTEPELLLLGCRRRTRSSIE